MSEQIILLVLAFQGVKSVLKHHGFELDGKLAVWLFFALFLFWSLCTSSTIQGLIVTAPTRPPLPGEIPPTNYVAVAFDAIRGAISLFACYGAYGSTVGPLRKWAESHAKKG